MALRGTAPRLVNHGKWLDADRASIALLSTLP
jgi:hypothetical protein